MPGTVYSHVVLTTALWFGGWPIIHILQIINPKVKEERYEVICIESKYKPRYVWLTYLRPQPLRCDIHEYETFSLPAVA